WQRHLITSTAEAVWWWSGRSGALPNILLACGTTFDVWSVPRAVGSRAVELLPDDLVPRTPVALTPTGRWHLFTAPRAAAEELPPITSGLDVAHLGAGHAVTAP